MKFSFVYFIVLLFNLALFTSCKQAVPEKDFQRIRNDIFWDTQDGEPIFSQGGGIFKFVDPETGVGKYYWYGARYNEAALYRNDPSITQKTDSFLSVTCYTSADLVHWKFEGDVLTRAELDKNYDGTRWVGRLGVAYVKEINKYALFVQHDSGVLICVSDKPAGEFVWHPRMNMESMIGPPNT